MSSLPSNSHDWALWLHANLVDVQDLGDHRWVGCLPEAFNLDDIEERLESEAPQVVGIIDKRRRRIEFHPVAAHVYETLDQLRRVPANALRVPDRFTIRDVAYTGPSATDSPTIQGYFQSVQLWELLRDLADHIVHSPEALHFIDAPQRKIELALSTNGWAPAPLPGLEEFSRDFVRTEFHKEQKRDIVRTVLVDMFATRVRHNYSELLGRFSDFVSQVRASYGTFAADFSYKKVRDEVEKQNLDDTLRLNKTVSDIQNQLLALPAALILSAAGLQGGADLKNLAIVVGVLIFTILMWILVSNQQSSAQAISGEVALRKALVARQPVEVSAKFEKAFKRIDERVKHQAGVLRAVRVLVCMVCLTVFGLAAYQTWGVATPSAADRSAQGVE